MCRLEGRSPGLGGVGTGSVRAELPSNCCAGLTVGGAGRSLIGRRLANAAAVVFELILKIIIILLIIFLGFIKSKPC